MHNVKIAREGKDGETIVIRIAAKDVGRPSASGKSLTIASSGGKLPVEGPEGIVVNLTAYRPVPKTEWSPETLRAHKAKQAAIRYAYQSVADDSNPLDD